MKNQLGLLTSAFLVVLTTTATATIRYVDLNCTNATPPFTNWPTAATNIQDAIDGSSSGDMIWVTNGVYQFGGRLVHGAISNRVAVVKALTLRSVNGPMLTIINGGSMRGAYLTNGATLVGFTFTNCQAPFVFMIPGPSEVGWGGGIWCESTQAVISNCVINGNFAAGNGGGAYGGTFYNCVFTNNSAQSGGGAHSSILSNCTIVANSTINLGSGGGAWGCALYSCKLNTNYAAIGGGAANSTLNDCSLTYNVGGSMGGGASSCTLNNCTIANNSLTSSFGSGSGAYQSAINNSIVYYNSSPNGDANQSGCYLNYSCTFPLSDTGVGNFTNSPRFVDLSVNDLHLQSNSPCINAGNNAYATNSTDFDGNPRIAGGTVDMGAYEFQGTGLSGFPGWLWQHGLRIDGTADSADSDGDAMNNWREWIANTDPTNALSLLKMLLPAGTASGVTVSWQSVNTRSYFLERATDVGAQPPFQILQTNITGQAGTTSYTDTNTPGSGPFFYRVGVQQ